MADREPTVERPHFQPRPEYDNPSDINFLFRLTDRLHVAPGGCWEWAGAQAPGGYGVVTYKKRQCRVHRVVYELCVDSIPAGLNVCHDCPDGDNPLCCNPGHLFLGTQLENVHDCMTKGRLHSRSAPVGELNPNAKITTALVQEIRHRVATGPRGTQKQLQQETGLSRAAISRIVRCLAWAHVDGFPCFADGGGI
jgi:hypothetical protein